jgi:hydroxymethylpyrimidine kinase/phosphomethylpyrimidine kinase
MTAYRAPGELHRAPDVLVCAGLDPSGGAGLIADVRLLSKLGCRPAGVVTTLTVQNTTGIVESSPVDAELVGNQLAFLLSDIEVRAVKIGMIGTGATAKAIANALQLSAAPVVWDPELSAPRGDASFSGELRAADAMLALRPHLTLITPNRRELFELTGMPVADLAMAAAAARVLAQQLDAAVLVKGGHFVGLESPDILVTQTAQHELQAPRLEGGEDVHGTGDALATAIAAHLANGRELVEACRLAKEQVSRMIEGAVHPGRGAASVL